MPREDSWSALARHAARHPYDPWLFYPEPPDWRWISQGDGLERVEAVRRSLVAAGREQVAPGTVVAFRDLPEVSRCVADLAVQAAGLVSAPLAAGGASAEGLRGLEGRGVGLWLGSEGKGDGPPDGSGLPCRQLEPASPGSLPAGEESDGARGGGEPRTAGVQVRDRTGRIHLLPGGWLAWAAGRLGARLPKSAAGRKRHVVLHWRPLEDPGERVFTTWALRAGAAIVLVPEALGPLQALHWCRPTILQGAAAELDSLASALEAVEGGRSLGRLRRRFGRLTRVVVLDQPEEAAREVRRWEGLGAKLVGLPRSLREGDLAPDVHGFRELADNVAW